jgi:hypothetical protein
MAKDDDTASKRLADETARDRATINLQRAFDDLVPKLNRAYGQPARDEADERSQHVVALLQLLPFWSKSGRIIWPTSPISLPSSRRGFRT